MAMRPVSLQTKRSHAKMEGEERHSCACVCVFYFCTQALDVSTLDDAEAFVEHDAQIVADADAYAERTMARHNFAAMSLRQVCAIREKDDIQIPTIERGIVCATTSH